MGRGTSYVSPKQRWVDGSGHAGSAAAVGAAATPCGQLVRQRLRAGPDAGQRACSSGSRRRSSRATSPPRTWASGRSRAST